MASKIKIYTISYWTEKSIVHPVTSEIFYKVKSVSKQIGGSPSGITINEADYKRWKGALTPFHYINDSKYLTSNAYVDSVGKSDSETIVAYSQKEANVSKAWIKYVTLDQFGNSDAVDFKNEARSSALFLTEDGQKAFIITQMMYLDAKIKVLTDLMEDTSALDVEYNDLIDEYTLLMTT